MRAWVRRPFDSWTEFFEYLVFMVVCVAGVLHASWLWIVIGAMVLFILAWPRWRELVEKAGRIDTQYLVIGRLAWRRARLLGLGLRLLGNAHHVLLILGAKLGFDALWLTGVFVVGYVVRWVWIG